MQCELTKFVIAAPLETKDANTVASTLVNEFILKYGHFKVLKTDQGTEFTNKVMQEICKLLEIKQTFSTPYHHQTMGVVERNHRVLNEYILSFAEDLEWDKWIPYYAFAYNTTPHVDTNYTPYELVFGKLPYLPFDLINNNDRVYNLDNYANELKIRLKTAISRARDLIDKSKKKRVEKHINTNPIDIKTGDLVLLRNEDRKKLQKPYKGPYPVIERKGVNSLIDINGTNKLVHNDRLKRYNVKN